MYNGCQLREWIEMRDLLLISRSALTSSGVATLCNGMYCSFCMYVCMYECVHLGGC